MTYTKCLQLVVECKDQDEMANIAEVMQSQDGLIGLRSLPANLKTRKNRVQLFLELGNVTEDTLPDGCKIVMLSENVKKSLLNKVAA